MKNALEFREREWVEAADEARAAYLLLHHRRTLVVLECRRIRLANRLSLREVSLSLGCSVRALAAAELVKDAGSFPLEPYVALMRSLPNHRAPNGRRSEAETG